MRNVTITIGGCTGDGKTTLARAIEHLCKSYNISCDVVDDDGSGRCPRWADNLEKMSGRVNVKIKTVQLIRSYKL